MWTVAIRVSATPAAMRGWFASWRRPWGLPSLGREPKSPSTEVDSEKKVFDLYEKEERIEPVNISEETQQPEVNEARPSQAEHQQRGEQRVSKVRELNQRLRTPNGLSDLEREPAYKRKNIQLNDSTASTDSNISRYTLNEETDENGERRVELKRNNPYLHDNVD